MGETVEQVRSDERRDEGERAGVGEVADGDLGGPQPDEPSA